MEIISKGIYFQSFHKQFLWVVIHSLISVAATAKKICQTQPKLEDWPKLKDLPWLFPF